MQGITKIKFRGYCAIGNHLIAAWSRVQPRIALSSGEAELHAGMRGISETLGFVHMMREVHTPDWGHIIHRVDASACRAIILDAGVEVSSTSPSSLCGFKRLFATTQLYSREFRAMRCMRIYLPLHPARKIQRSTSQS